jgi:hypothetical protein
LLGWTSMFLGEGREFWLQYKGTRFESLQKSLTRRSCYWAEFPGGCSLLCFTNETFPYTFLRHYRKILLEWWRRPLFNPNTHKKCRHLPLWNTGKKYIVLCNVPRNA